MFKTIAAFTIVAITHVALAAPSEVQSMAAESMRGNFAGKAPGVEDLVHQALELVAQNPPTPANRLHHAPLCRTESLSLYLLWAAL